jgi:hypothetical protein
MKLFHKRKKLIDEIYEYPIDIKLSLQYAKTRMTQADFNSFTKLLRKHNIDFSLTINANHFPYEDYDNKVNKIIENLDKIII